MADLQITQVRSLIGAKRDQRATVQSLGLRRIRHTVTQPDRPEIRGMVAKVSHLVEVRYAEAPESVLELHAGQTPHGVGNPVAGSSVADEDAAARAVAAEEALAAPGTADQAADVTERAPHLASNAVGAPDAPNAPASPEDIVDPQSGPQGDQ